MAATAAALFWGGNFVAVRIALEFTDPYLLTTLRFAGVACLLLFLGWPTLPFRILLMYAFFSGVGQYLCSTLAIQMGLSPGLAALLMQLQVFFSLGISYLVLHEALSVRTVVGSILGISGLAGVLLTGGTQAPVAAATVCLLSALGWSGANMLVKQYPENAMRLQATAGLLCLPIVCFLRVWSDPGALPLAQGIAQLPWSAWLCLAYMVVVSLVLAQKLWGFAIVANGLGDTAPVALLISVFGLLISWLVLSERLSDQVLFCVGVVLIGIAVHMKPLSSSLRFQRKSGSSDDEL